MTQFCFEFLKEKKKVFFLYFAFQTAAAQFKLIAQLNTKTKVFCICIYTNTKYIAGQSASARQYYNSRQVFSSDMELTKECIGVYLYMCFNVCVCVLISFCICICV